MKRLGMKVVTPLALAMVAAGCDGIFSMDNWDPPESELSGVLTYQGKPLGVRLNSTFLDLWQTEPEYPIEQRIDVYVNQEGQFRAKLFDGTYEVNVRSGSYGWVDNSDTRYEVVLRGQAELEIPMQPYYTIENETFTYTPGPGPGGSITATFTVGKHNQDLNLEFVGVYVATRAIVDRTNSLSISNSVRERTRAQIQEQLDSNSPITITIPLPDDIHVTPSPARRNFVHVRVGVKTVGRTELVYTPLHKVDI